MLTPVTMSFGSLVVTFEKQNYDKNNLKPLVLSTFAMRGDFLRILFRTFREVFENNFSEPML